MCRGLGRLQRELFCVAVLPEHILALSEGSAHRFTTGRTLKSRGSVLASTRSGMAGSFMSACLEGA